MSDQPKITGIRLNGWGILALVLIVFFFWEPLLIIGGTLAAGWLFYQNRKKILLFLQNRFGKKRCRFLMNSNQQKISRRKRWLSL